MSLADCVRTVLAHTLDQGEQGDALQIVDLSLWVDTAGLVSPDNTVWRLPSPEEAHAITSRLSALLMETTGPSKRSH